jgi:hypothetical protein
MKTGCDGNVGAIGEMRTTSKFLQEYLKAIYNLEGTDVERKATLKWVLKTKVRSSKLDSYG